MAQGSGNNVFELNALGGVADQVKPHDTAFVHRNMLYWFLLNGHWSTEDEGAGERKWLNDFNNAMKPYLTRGVYQNMPDGELKHPLQEYYGSNLPRLIEIKRKYDPDNVFNYAQSIPPN